MSTRIYGQGCLDLPFFDREKGYWKVVVPGQFIDHVVCTGSHEECHAFIRDVREKEKQGKNIEEMNSKINALKAEQRTLQTGLLQVNSDLSKAQLEETKAVWGKRLIAVERRIIEMITAKEITPYMGGEPPSAYIAILKSVAESCFEYRLTAKDVSKVIERFLTEMADYHKQIDPTL